MPLRGSLVLFWYLPKGYTHRKYHVNPSAGKNAHEQGRASVRSVCSPLDAGWPPHLSICDFMPTIVEAATGKAPDVWGRSLLPLLREEKDVPWRDALSGKRSAQGLESRASAALGLNGPPRCRKARGVQP